MLSLLFGGFLNFGKVIFIFGLEIVFLGVVKVGMFVVYVVGNLGL